MIIDIPNFEFDINYIELYKYNPLLSDLSEENLKQIAREYFGFEYMEETDEIPTYPVHGIILPPYNRCIVPMICRVKNCVGIKTLFLVDSGTLFFLFFSLVCSLLYYLLNLKKVRRPIFIQKILLRS